ncbi:hypothetical protein [Acetobacter ghanensis]|jgi:hypothetical protein|nr:hypothetical protein [Acetobacter ghanensis]MCI1244206.1 hypothetical protein [Acetobacter fabarum]MCI1909268.1 hypothetical protein [Acetobacter fabarum]MCI1927246.1 hypothetical protein [Acetobacter fabarum]MCI1947246.1 hypothetical protein [Acetobacter fabarum]MCI1988500.1 hypothetical protein [Acetobacter fabarum]
MTNNAHEVVLAEETIILPGDKVRVGPDADAPFKRKIDENGVCVDSVNSSKGFPVKIKFDDGVVIEGFRSGLIMTERYGGSAPVPGN